MKILRRLSVALTLPFVLTSNPLLAEEAAVAEEPEKQGFFAQFKDPEDGKFDMSKYLLENFAGFMPVPVIITEPAVDGGLGMAGIFFHTPKDDQMKPDADGKVILPNISVVAVGVGFNVQGVMLDQTFYYRLADSK